jgi:phosphotriesterase-related protein
MSTVETVQGPVDAGELGVTLAHEHVRFRDEAIARNWPSLYDGDEELARAIDAVTAAKAHGVETIVDPTAMFGGREVRFMKHVADLTGVRIVPCTGIYTYDYLPHHFANGDADHMASLFVQDITTGIQATEIKAAFIKCAADEPGLTENIEKVHRAAARASLQTGAPIMAHSRPASQTGPRQVEIFLEEGVAPEKIQIAHCGDSPDPDYVQGLIDTGVYVGLDRYGLEMFLPIDQRNAVTAELLRRGHADQLMISQDYTVTIDWFPGPMEEVEKQFEAAGAIRNWSMTLVFEEVIPWLREQGVYDDATHQTIFVDNPRRWLTGA